MATSKREILRITWKHLRSALHVLAHSPEGPKALWLSVVLFLIMISINGLNVVNSYVGREFMTAIEHKDFTEFQIQALRYAGVFVACSVMLAFYRFTEERIGILWREQLTWRLTNAYLDKRAYFRLDSVTGVANPDQRIAEDVKVFTTTTLSFVLLLVNGCLTAVSFSGVLWSISQLLFWVAVVYAVCGSLITIFLGKRMISLNYHQLDMEANFRTELIHVRENSESIAIAHREGRFKARLKNRLNNLAFNFRRLIRVNRNLGFFTNGYNYFIQIIPALIIAPMFIRGEVEFGVITQATMAYATLLGSFSLVVTQFQSISTFTAVTARVHLLSDAISKAHHAKHCRIDIVEDPNRVVYENVTIRGRRSKSSVLIEKLNLEIQRGSKWLVTSEEDLQHIALFRATAGLWDSGEGNMIRPGLDDLMFLPERPYLPPGTLRDVLLRTGMEEVTTDDTILAVLRQLHLEEIVEQAGGLMADKDWDEAFSISEQHMLSIARLILARPAFVFLDRPGSSLPTAKVQSIIEMLSAKGIGVVVLSNHDETRLKYDFHLKLKTGGSWTVQQDPPAGDAAHQ